MLSFSIGLIDIETHHAARGLDFLYTDFAASPVGLLGLLEPIEVIDRVEKVWLKLNRQFYLGWNTHAKLFLIVDVLSL